MLNRFAYRIYRRVTAVNHWAKRRLTPGGWLVLVGLTLTGGMATDTEQSLGYQAFALLFCLAAAAVILAPFFRGKFSAERELPRFGSVGQPLRYQISIRNHTCRARTGLQALDNLVDSRPGFAEFVAAFGKRVGKKSGWATAADPRRVRGPKVADLPALPPGGVAAANLELLPLKRGTLRFQSVTVARPDPFGLFRGFRTVPCAGSLVILPRRYPLPALPLPGAQRYQHGGVALAAAIGESEEFVSLRDYRPGDPMRRIHWRSWAKAGRPVVKEFQDEFFVRHALVLDTFAPPEQLAAFEEAVSVAASLACTLDTQESLLDLLFVGPEAYSFTIGRGVAHAEQMLELLAAVQLCEKQPFAALQQIVVEHAGVVSGCLCIFLAWDEPRRELVRRLTALDVPVLVLVIREPGATPLKRQADDPAALHELEVGKIEEGLARL